MPAEVWLDEAGLVRRVAVNAVTTTADNAQVRAITELWDFGLAVDITPPRPDETAAPRDVA